MSQASRFFSLQSSEAAIFRGACDIYAAYIQSGRVEKGREMTFARQSVAEALSIAHMVEKHVDSDDEMGG